MTNQFKIEELIAFGEVQLKQIATKDLQIELITPTRHIKITLKEVQFEQIALYFTKVFLNECFVVPKYIFMTIQEEVLIKYENLSYYGNLRIITYVDVNFFITIYKKEDLILKGYLILLEHFSFFFL